MMEAHQVQQVWKAESSLLGEGRVPLLQRPSPWVLKCK